MSQKSGVYSLYTHVSANPLVIIREIGIAAQGRAGTVLEIGTPTTGRACFVLRSFRHSTPSIRHRPAQKCGSCGICTTLPFWSTATATCQSLKSRVSLAPAAQLV